jgi:aminoglycoside phosphotransferase family enzyme
MKKILTPAAILLGLSLSLIPTIASAQFNSSDNADPFKKAASGDTSALLNLINQAQINGKINPNYDSQQQEQLKSATDDFRSRQLQVLRERNKKAAPAPVVATPNN